MMIAKNKTTCRPIEKGFLTPSLRNESGVALIAALLFMVIMIALVPMALQLTSGEVDRTQNFKEDRQAFFVAEAGLEHAKALTEASSLAAVLAGPDGDETATSDNGTFGAGTPYTGFDGNTYDEVAFNGNNYYIRAYDNNDGDGDFSVDSDNIIILAAVGIVDENTTRVEATIYNPPASPTNAVTVNGNLDITGNPNITGACGSTHANGDLALTGSPDIDLNATASGSYNPTGSPTVGGTAAGGVDPVPVPDLDITVFESYADYTLAADGNVYDSNGTFIQDATSTDWNGWGYSSPSWTLSGNSTNDASLYVEGDVTISGGPGSPGTPWETTLVATGFIQISGNPVFSNKKNPSDPEAIQNLFFIAGTDIKYNGNPTQHIAGLIYAKEQVQISGNPDINGAIMSLENPSVEGLISQSVISGNATISYDCGLSVPGLSSNVNVVQWNQL